MFPFERSFRDSGQEIPRRILDQALSTDAELSGALNQALPALMQIRRAGRFSETPSTLGQMEEYRRSADPLSQWLAYETTASPRVSISQDELHGAYAHASLLTDRPIMTKQMFGRRLRALRPDVREAQRSINGKRHWFYLGLSLKDRMGVRTKVAESPGNGVPRSE
jgi:phage/plasmid-associated DNA primase